MGLKGRVVLPLIAALLLPFAAFAADKPALPADLDDFDAYVESVRAEFDVPGIAVAIVKDGELVLARGWGERELGKGEAVDADTLFAIASNTKAFTAAALSMLADEGKLSLDDRVIEHLPWFQMSDPYITREMTLRDLLTHRSGLGLGAGDLLFWPASERSTEELVRRLRHVPIESSFRSRYAYANLPYAVAKLVIEKVSGQTYEAFVTERIFARLDMDATRINHHAFTAADRNIATGHAKYDFKRLGPVPPMSWANNAAAGGIYSSVNDLAKWMRVQLDGGVIGSDAEGKAQRLFSEARKRAMWSIVTPIAPPAPKQPEFAAVAPKLLGYGEGWVTGDYRGQRLVWHTGGWPGMVSRVTLVPELKLGIAVLTSQEAGAGFNAPTYRILDAYLGAGKVDWVAAYRESLAAAQADADVQWQQHLRKRAARSKPALPLTGYAGTYVDHWYGEVALRVEGKRLVMQFAHTPQLLGDLEHWQHDSFIVRWRDRSLNADAFTTFSLDANGKVRELRIEAISPLTDFSFDFQDLRLTPVADKEP